MLTWIHIFKNGRSCNIAGSHFINYKFHHPLILGIARYRQKPFHVFLSQKITASLILDHRQEAVIPSSYPNRVALETSTRTQGKLIIICLQGAPAEMLLLDVTLGLMRSLVRLTFGPISAKNIIILVPPTTTTTKNKEWCAIKSYSRVDYYCRFPLFRGFSERGYYLRIEGIILSGSRPPQYYWLVKKKAPWFSRFYCPWPPQDPKAAKGAHDDQFFLRVRHKLFSSDLLILVFPAQHVHTVTTHRKKNTHTAKIKSEVSSIFPFLCLFFFFSGTKP